MTSALSDRDIKKSTHGSMVLGSIVLVRWVIIKKNYVWDILQVRNKTVTKLNILCENNNIWNYQNGVFKSFQSNMIGDRFDSTGNISLHSLKKISIKT